MARWLPVVAGAILVAAAPALLWLHAPAATPYASGLAGLTLLLLGWPQGTKRTAPVPAVASWVGLARDLHLRGAVLDPKGRMFLPSRDGVPPPLDDRRSLYDGSDGYAAGLALDNPVEGVLQAWLTADATRLGDVAALEEDLNSLAAYTGWFRNARVLPEAAGLRIRWESRMAGGEAEENCIAWLAAQAAARAARHAVRLTSSGPGESVVEWLA